MSLTTLQTHPSLEEDCIREERGMRSNAKKNEEFTSVPHSWLTTHWMATYSKQLQWAGVRLPASLIHLFLTTKCLYAAYRVLYWPTGGGDSPASTELTAAPCPQWTMGTAWQGRTRDKKCGLVIERNSCFSISKFSKNQKTNTGI